MGLKGKYYYTYNLLICQIVLSNFPRPQFLCAHNWVYFLEDQNNLSVIYDPKYTLSVLVCVFYSNWSCDMISASEIIGLKYQSLGNLGVFRKTSMAI